MLQKILNQKGGDREVQAPQRVPLHQVHDGAAPAGTERGLAPFCGAAYHHLWRHQGALARMGGQYGHLHRFVILEVNSICLPVNH